MIKKQELSFYATGRYAVLSSGDYNNVMKTQACPLLEQLRQNQIFSREDTQKLYCEYYIQPKEQKKGTILILHGFTESCDKYHEVIYYMLTEGYCVVMPEHRGHGRSRHSREADIANTPTYVEHFRDYVEDADLVVNELLKKKMPKPYYLFAHSMGGAVATAYMEAHPGIFRKAVLSAPMLEINRGGVPKFAAKAVAALGCAAGRGHSFLIGNGPYSAKEDFEGSAATCRERYCYYYEIQKGHPEYQNAGASFRWAREALRACDRMLRPRECRKVDIPVLLFQAQKDDFVYPGGQELFIQRIPNGSLVYVPGTKHEIYLSEDDVLALYWNVVFDFLADTVVG